PDGPISRRSWANGIAAPPNASNAIGPFRPSSGPSSSRSLPQSRPGDPYASPVDADVIVVGAGLAGLVAAHELTSAGKRVCVVDQENAANLGGQAWWSFGGLFL